MSASPTNHAVKVPKSEELARRLHFYAANNDSHDFFVGRASVKNFPLVANSPERIGLEHGLRTNQYTAVNLRMIIDGILNAWNCGGDSAPGVQVSRSCHKLAVEMLFSLHAINPSQPLGDVSSLSVYQFSNAACPSEVSQKLFERDQVLCSALQAYSSRLLESYIFMACRDPDQLLEILMPFDFLRKAASLTREVYNCVGSDIVKLSYPEVVKAFPSW